MSRQSIIDRVRLDLRDQAVSFEASLDADGTVNIFDLPVMFVRASDLVVAIDNVATTAYSVEESEGVIRFSSPPTVGEEITVRGFHYRAFTDTEIGMLVDTAFGQHTSGQNPPVALANPLPGQKVLPAVEEYLVAILAEVEALWILATDAAQDIDIHSPDGVVIPLTERFQQILNLIQAKKDEYKTLAAQLGVGIYRIEVFDLRRRSRMTNRLVPLYEEMEYDEINNGFSPIQGLPGTKIVIVGKFFTGVTEVKFHDTPGDDLTVVDDETIIVTVPTGATTGPLHITGPGGTLTTASVFRIEAFTPVLRIGPTREFPPVDVQGTV